MKRLVLAAVAALVLAGCATGNAPSCDEDPIFGNFCHQGPSEPDEEMDSEADTME